MGLFMQPNAQLTATDAAGRNLPDYESTGPVKKNKFVGLFYWTWHMQQSLNNAPLNVSEYISRKPSAIHDYNDSIWPKVNSPWFWAEPLFGYYINTDEWVLRKHAEMLADAGVDVIIFDCTNANFTWKESYLKLCEVFTKARADGVATPQIAFMLPFWITNGGKEILYEIYTDLYKPGLYKDLWFYWKGKPLIMGSSNFADKISDSNGNLEEVKEMKNFFTFRPGQPVYNKGPEQPDQWGWLEIFPQHGFAKNKEGTYEQATVGVAQNWTKERGLTAMNAFGAFGRSFTHAKGHNYTPYAVNYGYNFQEQWERALQLNPEFIFITGWNEWIAGRYPEWQQQTNAFPDEFDQEHSRDIEPMKGGHGDNYYYQMVANIRRFKGMEQSAPASPPASIAIDGKFDEWKNVYPSFKAYKGNTLHRNCKGWGSLHYSNYTGRNDIVLCKIARDNNNVFFYVETDKPLSSKTDTNWMLLFIDIDKNKNTGWEGYDFVVNRLSPGDKAVLETTAAGWNWEKIAEVDYKICNNKLELHIPKKILRIQGEPDFYFKWSDNMQQPNIMDFWINGDAAPAGRFNYRYAP